MSDRRAAGLIAPPRDPSPDALSAADEPLQPWLDLGATDVREALGPAAVDQTRVVLRRMRLPRLDPADRPRVLDQAFNDAAKRTRPDPPAATDQPD
jgi:hypothetical protein